MVQVQLGGKSVDVDKSGFIQDPELWNEAVAVDLARREGFRK
jgi:sulfur relay (sulfurtransferase) DsrC/TusE family protein